MIQIKDRDLASALARQLDVYQRNIEEKASYPAQIAAASSAFAAYNVKGNQTFDLLKAILDSMCSGARRCMYCEDSAADEIEHFRPKKFYPQETFRWQNLLYVCGQCNVSKRDKFAIRNSQGVVVHLSRKRTDIPVPPEEGTSVLLHPRQEHPQSYLMLDIVTTFAFVPSVDGDEDSRERAEYTIRTLALNRDLLIRARREAYASYVARVQEYIRLKNAGSMPEALHVLKSLALMHHPTVWTEIRRWKDKIPALEELFQKVPELVETSAK